jgi:TonB-dependent SusC/RagA subfamily outer membrane receptor
LINLGKNKKQDPAGSNKYFGTIQGTGITGRRVQISIKNRPDQLIQPKEDGSYSILAKSGDVLVVRTDKGQFVEKELGDNRNIDIWLNSTDQIRLEEVVLTGVQEEPVEEALTAYGDKNKDAVGYAVQSITDEDISEISTTVSRATQGKFSGVRLGQNDDLSQAIIRPSNSILGNNYGLIVVDGVALKQSNSATGEIQSTTYLDPNNIAKITVLKGLAATNRFGSMGANGVILITTKTATIGKKEEYRDLALVNDNVYEGKLKVSAKTLVTPYLKALKGAKNVEEAYALYLDQRDKYSASPAFYIDVFEYFRTASLPLAIRILSNVLEDDAVNYSAMRAMLLKCQQQKLNQLELETAEKILERFPQKIQSYLDYGIALKSNGQYQESLDQLLKILEGTANASLDFTDLKKSVDAELKNLIYNHSRELNLSKVSPAHKNNLRYDARLVFDWNHPSAEFELQFVNPQKRYFTWEHTIFADPQRIQQEIQQGFSREEFEVVGQESHGDWLVNVKFMGNANSSDETPTFLRCKVYYNFGKPDQREEVKLIRLHEKDSEEQFLKLKVE